MSKMSTADDVLEVAGQILLRCTVMGIAALLIWWGALEFFGDLAYRVHSGIIPLSREHFDLVQYAGMLTTKAGVSLLFFFPYIAIRLVIIKRRKGSLRESCGCCVE